MYQTILVPTDFSEPAALAWSHAAALAQAGGATLVALYVAEPVLSHYGVVGLIPSVTELEAQHDIASRLKVQELVEKAQAEGLAVRSRIVVGKPWEKIVEAAAGERADLIVIGTHGRTGLTHGALGSTAERVVQRAPCPVLVVRPQQGAG
jgi:universal stress protein A